MARAGLDLSDIKTGGAAKKGRTKGTNEGKSSKGGGKSGGKSSSKSRPRADRQYEGKSSVKTKRNQIFDDDDDYEDDEDDGGDDEVLEKARSSKENGSANKIIFIVIGVVVVIVVVLIFLLLNTGKGAANSGTGSAESEEEGLGEVSSDIIDQTTPSTAEQGTTHTTTPDSSSLTDDELAESMGVGTQDFTQNTNNQTDSTIGTVDDYIKDIYGLTTRVDYNVERILNTTDFVSYVKHRGTWGGGIELYWLECEYKGAKCVIQVPFQYYKELDDVGVVPVKMEVLQIKGETDGEDRTIISYMSLDATTLEQVMKSQGRNTK